MQKCFTLLFLLFAFSFSALAQTKTKKTASDKMGAPTKADVLKSAAVAPVQAEKAATAAPDVLRILVLSGKETEEELFSLEKEVLQGFANLNIYPVENPLLRYIRFPNPKAAEAFRLGNPSLTILTPAQFSAVAAAMRCQSDFASPELLEKLSQKQQ